MFIFIGCSEHYHKTDMVAMGIRNLTEVIILNITYDMSSEHHIDNALNIEYLSAGCTDAMQKAWCYETCWDGCKEFYFTENPELNPLTDLLSTGQTNPSFGNCLVSSLVAWADCSFKPELLPSLVYEIGKTQPAGHFFLALEDNAGWVDIDPTRQQFIAAHEVEVTDKGHERHHEILYYSIFEPNENARLRYRLGLLLERMDRHGYESNFTADEIMDRLEQKFTYASFYSPSLETEKDVKAPSAVSVPEAPAPR